MKWSLVIKIQEAYYGITQAFSKIAYKEIDLEHACMDWHKLHSAIFQFYTHTNKNTENLNENAETKNN